MWLVDLVDRVVNIMVTWVGLIVLYSAESRHKTNPVFTLCVKLCTSHIFGFFLRLIPKIRQYSIKLINSGRYVNIDALLDVEDVYPA